MDRARHLNLNRAKVPTCLDGGALLGALPSPSRLLPGTRDVDELQNDESAWRYDSICKHNNPRPESGTMTQRTGRKYVSLRALDNPASLMIWC